MKLQAAEIHYDWYERLAMRALFAVVIYLHIPATLFGFTISNPNGIARVVPLQFLLDPKVFACCRYLLLGALILYVCRIAWSFVLPSLTAFSIAVGTIVNSQGAIAHYTQIVSLVLCAQTAAHFYGLIKRQTANCEDRVIFWSQQTIVATYLVSALTKLIHTGGRWVLQSRLIGVQIIKSTDQDYYDQLDAHARSNGLQIAEWIVQHPFVVTLVLGLGLLLELTSPLALLGRRFALFYGLCLVAFHESVERFMQLTFPFNEYVVWIFLVNVPFWFVLAGRIFSQRAR